jgi:hypothetical protein
MANIDITFINAGDDAEMDVEMSDALTANEVIKLLIDAQFIPPLADLPGRYMLTIKGRNTIPEGSTFAEAAVRDGDHIRVSVAQHGGGGWVEILTVAASVGSIAQVALMIADMWARKQKKQPTSKVSQNVSQQSISKDWDHITRIYVEMTDSTQVSFNSWLADPEKIKSFVQTFNLPSASPKPLWVAFVFKDHTAIRVDASDIDANKQQLEQLIKYLKL